MGSNVEFCLRASPREVNDDDCESREVQLESGKHLVFQTISHFLTPLGIKEVAVKIMMSALEHEASGSTIVDDAGKPVVPMKAKLSGQYCVLDLNGVLRPCKEDE
jgi:hypothetical protein